MAENDESTENDAEKPEGAEEQAAPPKRSRLPLLLGLLLLLVAAGGGAVWYLGLLGGNADDALVDAATVDPTKGMVDPSQLGSMLELEPFIANLADAGGGRYLKTTFQIEFATDVVPPQAETRMPQIRDLVLTLLTSKTYDEIRTPAGKQNLREDIINRVTQVIDDDSVRAVYFTEFIVQ